MKMTFNVEANIREVKHKVEEKTNDPAEEIILIWLGKELKDDLSLKELKIPYQSEIFAFRKGSNMIYSRRS